MIVTVTPNPGIDRTATLPGQLVRGAVHRATAVSSEPGGKGVNVTRFLTAHGTESIAVLPAGGPMGHALISALDDGLCTPDELLDRVWSDAPSELRGAALLTLVAHLDRLSEDGLLPDGVERPEIPEYGEV